jgi:hypothetical protein
MCSLRIDTGDDVYLSTDVIYCVVNGIEEVEVDCMQTMDVNRGPLAHSTGMGALSRWEKERLFKATKRRYRQQQ